MTDRTFGMPPQKYLRHPRPVGPAEKIHTVVAERRQHLGHVIYRNRRRVVAQVGGRDKRSRHSRTASSGMKAPVKRAMPVPL